MTTPQYPEGYQPYTGAPGPTGPQPTPPNMPPSGQPAPPNQPPYYGGAPQPPYGAPPPYQQPPYGSVPPYGAPGYPPVYTPPAPPPKKRSNTGWIIGISIAVVILLICGGCGAFAYFSLSRGAKAISSTVGVLSTYTGFCVDESAQDYQSAYSYFSSNLQHQVSSTAFAQRAAQLDTRDGTVSSCLIQNGVPQINGSTATVQLTVTRTPAATATPAVTGTPTAPPTPSTSTTPTVSTGATPTTEATFTGALHLVLVGSQWKIDAIDSSLDLT